MYTLFRVTNGKEKEFFHNFEVFVMYTITQTERQSKECGQQKGASNE